MIILAIKNRVIINCHSPVLTCFILYEIISNIKDVDVIIIEGYSSDGDYPTISVARKETCKGVKGDLHKLVAVVSDYSKDELNKIGYDGEMYDINDLDSIIRHITENA